MRSSQKSLPHAFSTALNPVFALEFSRSLELAQRVWAGLTFPTLACREKTETQRSLRRCSQSTGRLSRLRTAQGAVGVEGGTGVGLRALPWVYLSSVTTCLGTYAVFFNVRSFQLLAYLYSFKTAHKS